MRITLYRLMDHSKFDNSVFRKPADYKSVDTRSIENVTLKLFVKNSFVGAPKWVQQLGEVVENRDDLVGLKSSSGAAVLLAEANGQVYAVCFGHGFQALRADAFARGFGVRVTANAIIGTKIKSADTRGLNRDGRSQKVVLPVASELGALGIEPTEEWVRQLSGNTADDHFASSASGSDSLKLSIKDFSLVNLGEKLARIEEYWRSDDYKAEFGFLDNFVKLDSKDPLCTRLDAELATLVLAGSRDIYFAEPDPFDRQAAESYRLCFRKRVELGELEQHQVFDALKKLNLPTLDPLRKVQVEAYDPDGTCIDTNDFYEYIQAEIKNGTDRYVLSAGVWFRVAADYVEQVGSFLSTIEDLTSTLALPSWPKKPSDTTSYIEEGDYNEQAAVLKGYAVLDKKNLHFGQYQKVEVCDLLTTDQEMICVKRAAKSSTLSHLFAQGNVSSTLMHESRYQKHVLTAMEKIGGADEWGSPSDWKIVFAIGTTKPGPLAENLFFFSQVNLMATVKDIRSRNLKVAIARIDQQP